MNAFTTHFNFEFRAGLRDRSLMLLNYLFPLGFYIMMGLIMVPINPLFLDTMIPAMVIFAALSGMLLGLPGPLVSSREAGIFRTYKINGVPALNILAIPALSAVMHALLAAIIIAATAPLLFGAPLPANGAAFVLVFVLFAFASAGLGVLIGVISSNSRSTVLWSQLVYLPSMLIGGLMFPASMLPETLRRVGMLLPANHAMSAFTTFAYGAPGMQPLWPLLVLLLGGIAAFALAIYLFDWDQENVSRRGHPLLAILVLLPYAAGALLLP